MEEKKHLTISGGRSQVVDMWHPRGGTRSYHIVRTNILVDDEEEKKITINYFRSFQPRILLYLIKHNKFWIITPREPAARRRRMCGF